MSGSASSLTLHAGEDYIELYKVLKVEGMTGDGAEAKRVIAEGMVLVNGEVETRKRKKLVAGDSVTFNGETVQILAG
ncbi:MULTISPECIES: RNA-binding S4 domain-containing protein [Shewanella]|uniref:RNA-binding S4 n=2 Tax=Shewanella TaxID=22 RepID=A1S515_SHEAM|nr:MULTISPECIES: RNA-binding S4 domain-containing protein [Shewanella]ABL99471.1 RNA-binding S4 [Shewanella amazonensis SB2B]MCL2916833.1 RNA-binding S4 domain-containing protein [Shewanella litorisediminis]QRH02999.1 RNA-binding S4 domain-containing protein [Shewanella litorisediminis]QYK06526.1 RNA-binding S4 domain-containing protein [Shewanella zhangzhouensis]